MVPTLPLRQRTRRWSMIDGGSSLCEDGLCRDKGACEFRHEPPEIRTRNTLIKSQLLYR